MLPTLNMSGDFLLIDYYSKDYRIGDVVVAVSPVDPTMNVCKRIVGMEGDEISSVKIDCSC